MIDLMAEGEDVNIARPVDEMNKMELFALLRTEETE
jgi:hypothetical protein